MMRQRMLMATIGGSNRTFMELKFLFEHSKTAQWLF